ncbi:hypothetical protein [Morganella morganii]|uniref:hypothetical protein n=1 Tax=Morganella morganii TaxID=582 RepID=UPI001BDA785B|nr:hypothetical protein [Morganella morganii]ELT0454158.1 hypothetical protein [Morganella morganii]MBT0338106.1 hypothetical protein [Morganella morganii subsp. morganii]
MSEKSKSIFGKLIDTADKSYACIYVDFYSNEDAQINVIQKNDKSAEINDYNNKELTLLLSDIQSQFKQQGISLNRVQGQPEGKRKLTAGLKTDKASLSETEVALQKMQLRAQELGAELVLTDRPAEMANERWRLPGTSGQENRSESMTAAEGLAKLAVAVQAVTDQCPLQITLMIQPDSRPQVMLNVSAGEVNWIFAAKEGRYPLKDLLAKMAGKTTTHGWDAIVVYQRGQANMLLKQQHIKRFITGNVLAPLNEDIESSESSRLQTHNLTLSAPHLSFDGAGAGDSQAQVSWDFVKGMIVFTQEADDGSYRVKKIEKITPLNSPFIGMKVPLSRARGSVNDVGEVQFDIKEGHSLTNNLEVHGLAQDMVSGFFKRHFEATPDDQRIYRLGTISNYEHEQFQPEMFEIRTMGAPNTASRGSQDEGDGAVVLFVQMKGSDSEPGRTKADWLLTDGYTSAMVVSNNQVFDNIKVRDDDFPVTFKKYRIGNDSDSLWGVKAVGGKYNGEYSYRDAFDYANIRTDYNIKFKFEFEFSESEQVKEIYKLYPDYINPGDKNEVVNKYEIFSNNVGIEVDSWYVKDNGEEGKHQVVNGSAAMKLIIDLWYMATVGLDEGNDIGLVNSNENLLKAIKTEFSDVDFPSIGIWDVFVDFLNRYVPKLLDGYINEKLKSDICDHFYKYNFQLLNTFVLGNLLFPGSNYFHSELAHLPGDLLVEGQLAPGSESFSVTPTETTIVAGSDYQFTTTPEVSGVKWSISDSEKGNTGVDLGHIDAATGKYTAPQAGTITEGVRHVVVCAEKGDTKVYALASVLAHSVNISPAYQVILPGKSSALTAESLNDGELTWTLADNPQGSALTKVSNNEYTYTAGKKNKKLKLNLERVSVTDKTGTTTEAMILVRNVLLTGYIRVSYNNMPENSVQLTYFPDPDNAETAIPADEIEWTVLESGGATLDTETGILSCNQPTDNGFAVISTKYLDEDEGALYCAIAIPLPLNTYKETILAAYSPEQS